MKKGILAVLLIILIAAGVMLLKKRRQTIAEAPVPTPAIHIVSTVIPETRTISQTSTFLARLESRNSAGISTKLSGRISELMVCESREVRQGDLLVHIDDREIRASIAALQANLTSARKQRDYSRTQYERNLALFKAGGIAREKLDVSAVARSAAVAAVKDLKQKIKGLENQLGYANIRAPFAGIVGSVFLRQGDLAVPGRPILTLNSFPQKFTFSFMPGSVQIQPGQGVMLNGVKTGTVTTLYNDAGNGLSVAEVIPYNRLDLPSGSYLTIEVVTKTASGCAVPVQALLHRARGSSIMVYRGDHFEEKPVSIKARDKGFALIDPCVTSPVAVASETKLSLLPAYGNIRISPGREE